MILLDENIRQDQGVQLRRWRVPVRYLVEDFAQAGIKDPDIIPLLHRLKQPTFFTHDRDFFQPGLAHPAYCLVWLDVFDGEAALFIRALLKHERFNTAAKRRGLVVRARHSGIHYWQRNGDTLRSALWLMG